MGNTDGELVKRGAVLDLRDASAYHQLTLNAGGLTPATQRNYLYYQRLFLRFLQEQRIRPTLEALNATNVRQALVWYQARPNPRRHRGGQVAAQAFVDNMKLWSKFLLEEEILDDDPLARVRRVKVSKHLREPYLEAEVFALWNAAQRTQHAARDEALFLLLLDTGMRIGEACSLSLDRLRLDQRQVLVGARGKGRRERVVPLGQVDVRDGGRTVRALRRYLAQRPDSLRGGDRLFVGREGYPLEAEGGSDMIARLGVAVGVRNCIAYRLRHTLATWYLVQHPGDELGLRRIIGHISKDVLADYVHFSQSIIAERAGRASLVESWLGGGVRRAR